MAISKTLRQRVFNKFDGRCSYCGKVLKYKDMQVDHMNPKCLRSLNMALFEGVVVDQTDHIDNLMPSCRRCNHYKRAYTLKEFRGLMETIHKRIITNYIVKVGLDYGIIEIKPFDGLFYFERLGANESQPAGGNI